MPRSSLRFPARRFLTAAAALASLLGAGLFPALASADDSASAIADDETPTATAHRVEFVRRDTADGAIGWQMLRDGEPYYAYGVGGGRGRLEELVALGGNSVRTWSPSREMLDRAEELGLTVMLGLREGKLRYGFDYKDPAAVAKQLEETRAIVRDLKDHPALLIWAVGNEPELGVRDAAVRAPMWRALGEIVDMIQAEDPDHPVITVVSGSGAHQLREIDAAMPGLDGIGLNTYGDLSDVPASVAKQGWTKPYFITEFGAVGHWQSPKTSWGLPIEQTSTQKAESYRLAYEAAIAGQPLCLGSYAFLWGNKQEKTHTWYGVLLPPNLEMMGPVDALSYCWTGAWPANRGPLQEGGIRVVERPEGAAAGDEAIFPAGSRIVVETAFNDPDGDSLRIEWDLRVDVSDNPTSGGDYEPPVEPIAGAIVEAAGGRATVQLPAEPKAYRLFVYAFDGRDHAATSNLPIKVE